MFYIYVRLLTIDQRYEMRKHLRYMVPSFVLPLLYYVGVLLEFGSTYCHTVSLLMKVTFVTQTIAYVCASHLLIRKYGDKARQFYSDMEDSRMDRVHLLNVVMLILACASIVISLLGRTTFLFHLWALGIVSVIFSSCLFIIGWLGNRQNVINPTFEEETEERRCMIEENGEVELRERNIQAKNELSEKLRLLMEEDQMYLDSKLTIRDLALAAHTNRTYLSNHINNELNQNFCSYINSYRVDYLKKLKEEHPEYDNNTLADLCGFGSVDSMKRAVISKRGNRVSKD